MSSRARIFNGSIPPTLKLMTVNPVIAKPTGIEIASIWSFKDE